MGNPSNPEDAEMLRKEEEKKRERKIKNNQLPYYVYLWFTRIYVNVLIYD